MNRLPTNANSQYRTSITTGKIAQRETNTWRSYAGSDAYLFDLILSRIARKMGYDWRAISPVEYMILWLRYIAFRVGNVPRVLQNKLYGKQVSQ